MPPTYLICGQTATGKTALSIALAQVLLSHGYTSEIISADSRQVYRGLDICSNKVTLAEMSGITHHGINITDAGTRYTVHNYQQYARHTLTEITNQNHTPIICGGTGLYIDATVFTGFDFQSKGSINYNTNEYWIPPTNNKPTTNNPYTWIGLHAPREYLLPRIRTRALAHQQAVYTEIQTLLDKGISRDWIYALGLEARYGLLALEGSLSDDQYIDRLTTDTWRYAKRQMTWFRRNPRIHWYDVSQNSISDILADNTTL